MSASKIRLACDACARAYDLETETMARHGSCWFCGRDEPGLAVARALRVSVETSGPRRTPAGWLEWALRSLVPQIPPGRYLVEWVVAQPQEVAPSLEVRLRVETRLEERRLVAYGADLVRRESRAFPWTEDQGPTAWLKLADALAPEMVARALVRLESARLGGGLS